MEASNVQKMREALEEVVKVGYPHNYQCEAPHIREYCQEITAAIKKCFSALSAPPRNCDVGTPEEINERWNRYCDERIERESCIDNCSGCSWRWSQMEYEEKKGETK